MEINIIFCFQNPVATAETGTCDQIDELIACMIAKLDRDHHSDDHDGDDNDKETKEEKKRKKSKG